ncbi:cytochrome c [Microbulbifer bruguierae]|uniref:Cytochrome c n=1 Tax=Microbulbifer bruguierae TaxID=3029061 RepID=A0ABY8N8W2_9GAMM|nr:cytochrome c [Microbulbifer bruguierae]WGL15326.1 cytochrome c [Microbulbifer bruguierae]
MKFRVLTALLLAVFSLESAASGQETRDLVGFGALTFADNCKKCHQIDGYGEEALYPSLRDPALLANKKLLIETLLHGRSAPRRNGGEEDLMPALEFLTDREISAIIAFISNTWGDEVLLVSEEEIKAAR